MYESSIIAQSGILIDTPHDPSPSMIRTKGSYETTKERNTLMSSSRRIAHIGLFSAVLLLGTFVLSASPMRSAHAEPLTCEEVRSAVDTRGELIRLKIDEEVAGFEHRFNRRKTLVVHWIESVSNGDDACEIQVVANVTLKRKWRRDAHGTVTVRAYVEVDAVEPRTFDVVFHNPYISDVSLSNTLDIGEAFYRWIANMIVPESHSIRISF